MLRNTDRNAFCHHTGNYEVQNLTHTRFRPRLNLLGFVVDYMKTGNLLRYSHLQRLVRKNSIRGRLRTMSVTQTCASGSSALKMIKTLTGSELHFNPQTDPLTSMYTRSHKYTNSRRTSSDSLAADRQSLALFCDFSSPFEPGPSENSFRAWGSSRRSPTLTASLLNLLCSEPRLTVPVLMTTGSLVCPPLVQFFLFFALLSVTFSLQNFLFFLFFFSF